MIPMGHSYLTTEPRALLDIAKTAAQSLQVIKVSRMPNILAHSKKCPACDSEDCESRAEQFKCFSCGLVISRQEKERK